MVQRFSILILTLATATSAQQFRSSSLMVRNGEVTAVYGPARSAPVVTGAPYAADELQEYTEPGATSPIRSSVIGHFVRDSQGRTRSTVAYKPAPYWLTEIFDPIAGVAILLDEDAKIAHRMTVEPAAPAISSPAGESLGTRVIDGVTAEGQRSNGRLVIETWTSPELKLELESRSSNGYSSRLTNLTRQEPDPSLFRPPSDYRIVDEPKPFPMSVRTHP